MGGCGRFAASPLHALFSVAVEGLALCACTLCSLGRVSAPCPICPTAQSMRRTGDAGAPLRGDGEDIVQGTPLERLSGNLRVPLWSFVSFVIPRNTSPLSNALFVARLPRPTRSNQASKPLNFQASRGAIAPTLLYSTSRTSPKGQKGVFWAALKGAF